MENENNLNNETKASPSLCTVTVISKPARKLLVMYAKKAHDYFSFCEEVGCEWEGLFNSIPSRLETAALITLPPSLIPEGSTETAAGVELDADAVVKIPEGCSLIELPPCDYLYFQSPPYENESGLGNSLKPEFPLFFTFLFFLFLPIRRYFSTFFK